MTDLWSENLQENRLLLPGLCFSLIKIKPPMILDHLLLHIFHLLGKTNEARRTSRYKVLSEFEEHLMEKRFSFPRHLLS